MSPTRSRKPVARVRPRSELVVAIAVAVGIVVATLFLVWALRPGEPGIPGDVPDVEQTGDRESTKAELRRGAARPVRLHRAEVALVVGLDRIAVVANKQRSQ